MKYKKGWGTVNAGACCSSYSGKPRSKDFHWRYYKRLMKEAGLPDIHWHDLRSICCTLLLNKDFNPKAVSKLMGHAKEIITMDVYGDNANIIPEDNSELFSYMNEVMPEKSNNDDSESNTQDIMIDMDKDLPKTKVLGEKTQIKVT